MKVRSLFFVTLSVAVVSFLPISAHAAPLDPSSTDYKNLSAANAQANATITSDNAGIATQEKRLAAAQASSDTATAADASARIAVDYDDIALQQNLIQKNNAALAGDTSQTTNLQAQVDSADAKKQTDLATLQTLVGNTGAATQATANAQTDTNAVQTSGATGNFVPLTNLPVFVTNVTTAPTFPVFFNDLYKYAIGIAATLAVLQIIYAGVLYMGGDSVTETKQAKEKIQWSILGLVLVLSPVIVFSIINPKILNLNIDFSCLAPGTSASSSNCPAPGTSNSLSSSTSIYNTVSGGVPTCTATIANGQAVVTSNDQACCYRQTQNACKVVLAISSASTNGLGTAPICACGDTSGVGVIQSTYYVSTSFAGTISAEIPTPSSVAAVNSFKAACVAAQKNPSVLITGAAAACSAYDKSQSTSFTQCAPVTLSCN